jgi:hypothetical protein
VAATMMPPSRWWDVASKAAMGKRTAGADGCASVCESVRECGSWRARSSSLWVGSVLCVRRLVCAISLRHGRVFVVVKTSGCKKGNVSEREDGCLTHGSLTQGSASRGNFASNSLSKTVPQLAKQNSDSHELKIGLDKTGGCGRYHLGTVA